MFDLARQDLIDRLLALEHIDWQLLHHLATDEGEARASSLNDRRYGDFLANYAEYAKEYGPCKS